MKIILVVILLFSFNHSMAKVDDGRKHTIHITLTCETAEKGDTASVKYYTDFFGTSTAKSLPNSKEIVSIYKGGFNFTIADVHQPLYVSISRHRKRSANNKGSNDERGKSRVIQNELSPYYFVAIPGDDVQIEIRKEYKLPFIKRGQATDSSELNIKQIFFSGTGCANYQCNYELICHDLRAARLGLKPPSSYKGGIWRRDSLFSVKQACLDTFRDKLTGSTFQIIQADIIGEEYASRYRMYYNYLGRTETGEASTQRSSIKDTDLSFDSMERFCQLPQTPISTFAKTFSWAYCQAMLEKVRVKRKKLAIAEDIESMISKEYSGAFRDKVLTYFLLTKMTENNFPEIVQRSLHTITEKRFINILRSLSENLTTGMKAYNFELTDLGGNKVRLSDFYGKVVFLDFWYTGCFGCAAYFQSTVSKVEEEFRKNQNVVFISVSIDCTVEQWKKSVMSNVYSSPDNVINLFTNGECDSHEVIKKYNVTRYARPVIIDATGNIFSSGSVLLTEDGLRKQIVSALSLK